MGDFPGVSSFFQPTPQNFAVMFSFPVFHVNCLPDETGDQAVDRDHFQNKLVCKCFNQANMYHENLKWVRPELLSWKFLPVKVVKRWIETPDFPLLLLHALDEAKGASPLI